MVQFSIHFLSDTITALNLPENITDSDFILWAARRSSVN